jgi:cytochrome c biogenesis protein CcmG, thiol:disulfide interchange protein DsbE
VQRLKLFLPLIVFALVVAFFFSTMKRIDEGDYNPQAMPSALVNRPFPAFSLSSLEQQNQQVTHKALLGHISLVNVWATWCPSCHVEHGYLNYLATERGIAIFGVNYKDNAGKALSWLEQKGNPYRVNFFDPQGRLGLDMGVTGAPETYVVDHRGFVRMRFQGPLNEAVWQEKFKPLFDQLQKEQQSDPNFNAEAAG